MPEPGKDGRLAADRAREAKTGEKIPAGNCEICGQKLERDPESGDCFCPDCDNPDQ